MPQYYVCPKCGRIADVEHIRTCTGAPATRPPELKPKPLRAEIRVPTAPPAPIVIPPPTKPPALRPRVPKFTPPPIVPTPPFRAPPVVKPPILRPKTEGGAEGAEAK